MFYHIQDIVNVKFCEMVGYNCSSEIAMAMVVKCFSSQELINFDVSEGRVCLSITIRIASCSEKVMNSASILVNSIIFQGIVNYSTKRP